MLSNNYVNTLLFGIYPYICLVGPADRQPDPLRPRALHLEERFLADAAQARSSGSARTSSTTA